MKLQAVEQIESLEEISKLPWDILIVASSFESRAIDITGRLASSGNLTTIKKKYFLQFQEHKRNLVRRRNDRRFAEWNFEPLQSSSSDSSQLVARLSSELRGFQGREHIRLLIDYSCMTKVMYGGIVKLLAHESYSNMRITVGMCYCHGSYVPPPKRTRNMYVGPISGYSFITPVLKPTALIIGLGYESNRAYGLQEYFDATTFLFLTNGDVNRKYAEDAARENGRLIRGVAESRVYYYSLKRFATFYEELRALCSDLSSAYRLVIAPCGPKPFTLAAMLTSVLGDTIEIWRVSAAEEIAPRDKTSTGEHILVLLQY